MCYNPRGYGDAAIDVTFTNAKLARTCSSETAGKKRYGRDWPIVRRRLKELEAAPTLADMPVGHPHPLSGNRDGEWAVRTTANDRIVFLIDHDPVPLLEQGGIDTNAVTAIAITEVNDDYH